MAGGTIPVGARRADRRQYARGAPDRVEQALAGKPATTDTIAGASAAASVDDLNSDIHASDEYRRAMIMVFTRRALEAALARA